MITKRPDPEGRIGEVSGSKRVCCGRGFMQLIGEELMARKMTNDSHSRGSEEDHNRRKVKKENAKENGKRMSQEELDKEIAEMKEQLNVLMMILEENQRLGWVLSKKPVRWHKLQRRLQEKKTQQVNMQLAEELMKLEQVLGVQLRSEELREA